MDVAVLPVCLLAAVRAVVGILIGEHAHVLADGACTGILEHGSTSGRAGIVVVEGVLQRQVLQVEVRAAVVEQVGTSQTLHALVGRSDDDGLVHRLSDDRDVVAGDGRLDGSIEVVGAVGQEDERAGSVLRGVLAVHHVEHIHEAAGVACLHEVPVALALEVHLGGVHNLHAVDVHLAATLHLQRQRTSFALIVVDSRTAVALSNGGERLQRLTVLLHGNACAGAILAECYCDDSLRTYEQVDGVAVLEGPSVLLVVPVEAVASRGECLMVLSIEELVGQVEVVLLVGAGHLYLGLDGVELGVGGDDVGGRELLAEDSRLEPAARLVALLRGSSVGNVVGKGADGGVLLNSLCCQHAAVNANVLQLVVGLEDDVQHIVHLCVAGCHRNGDGAGVLLLVISDVAYGAALSGDVGQRVALADHSLCLRQFQRGLIQLAEYVFDSILIAIDLERGEYGNVLLGAVHDTLDDDVAHSELLALLQAVEVEQQGLRTFRSSCVGNVVRQLTDVGRLVVTLRLHGLCNFQISAIGNLPCHVNQSVVSSVAAGLQRNLRGLEGEAGLRGEREAYGTGLVGRIEFRGGLKARHGHVLFCLDILQCVLVL